MMRISRIEVHGFKSLVDFAIDLPKFTCLVGLNGSGKSTILQFLDFLSRLVVSGGLDPWLDERGWKSRDLLSRFASSSPSISFAVHFDLDRAKAGVWRGAFDLALNACLDETIEIGGSILMRTSGGTEVMLHQSGSSPLTSQINFVYEGSILSQIKDDRLPDEVRRVKELVAGIQALDQLAPNELRRRAREASGTLGAGGRNLSALIYEMSDEERRVLLGRMRQVYPRLTRLIPTSLTAGWKQLEIEEEYESRPTTQQNLFPSFLTTEARHVNDGMLRVLAILAELQSPHPIALFDEIENGLNPEVVEFVVDSLVEADKQIVVTTHSPMILNYLEDETARESVQYVYKRADGATRVVPFFDIPSMREKLRFMGPGEAFADTDLTRMEAEIHDVFEAR